MKRYRMALICAAAAVSGCTAFCPSNITPQQCQARVAANRAALGIGLGSASDNLSKAAESRQKAAQAQEQAARDIECMTNGHCVTQ